MNTLRYWRKFTSNLIIGIRSQTAIFVEYRGCVMRGVSILPNADIVSGSNKNRERTEIAYNRPHKADTKSYAVY